MVAAARGGGGARLLGEQPLRKAGLGRQAAVSAVGFLEEGVKNKVSFDVS